MGRVAIYFLVMFGMLGEISFAFDHKNAIESRSCPGDLVPPIENCLNERDRKLLREGDAQILGAGYRPLYLTNSYYLEFFLKGHPYEKGVEDFAKKYLNFFESGRPFLSEKKDGIRSVYYFNYKSSAKFIPRFIKTRKGTRVVVNYNSEVEKQEFFKEQRGKKKERDLLEYIFVIGGDKNIYVHPKIDGKFHHSTFLGGKPVISAGKLFLNKGDSTIKRIENYSGHYKPTNLHAQYTLDTFKEKGSRLEGVEFVVRAMIKGELERVKCEGDAEKVRVTRICNKFISLK